MSNAHDNPVLHTQIDTSAGTGIDGLIERLNASSRYIALLTAWVAMCGSLFMSEVFLWVPCVLCWYQRILMYPLALILPIGIVRRDRDLHWYVLPLSLFGAGMSLYHYLLIKTDWFPPPPCTASIPCTTDYLNVLGFINVPFLALTAFLIISVMVFGSALSMEPEAEGMTAARSGVSVAALVAVIVIIVAVVAAFVALGVMILR